MTQQSPVFQEIYDDYLRQVAAVDLAAVAPLLGGRLVDGGLELELFGRPHLVGPAGITDHQGRRPIHSISVILCKYILLADGAGRGDDRWVAYKELADTAPFVPGFDDTAQRVVARAFAGDLAGLDAAAKAMGGQDPKLSLGYDLVRLFWALPAVPMLMLFNDADEGFPAHCSLLFRADARRWLDAECLAICGMVLAARLKAKAEGAAD